MCLSNSKTRQPVESEASRNGGFDFFEEKLDMRKIYGIIMAS
jgi:hypothetical protein